MKRESIKMSVKNGQFKVFLKATAFKEGNSFILYMPSLELSAYGDTEKEAHEMMEDALRTFFKDLLALSQHEANQILSDLGWTRDKFFKKRRVHLSDTTFEDIKREFNLPENTEAKQIPIAIYGD